LRIPLLEQDRSRSVQQADKGPRCGDETRVKSMSRRERANGPGFTKRTRSRPCRPFRVVAAASILAAGVVTRYTRSLPDEAFHLVENAPRSG